MIRFRLDIEPRGKGSVRAAIVGGHARTYKDTATRTYERQLSLLALPYRPRTPFKEPVSVTIDAVFDRPKYMRRRSKVDGRLLGGYPEERFAHFRKPDPDNISKSVLDALKTWWVDDALVARLLVRKWYRAMDERPGLEIEIDTMEEVCHG